MIRRFFMNVIILTKEYPPEVYGGAGVHVENLSRELARRIPVEVRCFGRPRPSHPAPKLTVRAYRPPIYEAGDLGGKAAYAGVLETIAVDLA
ncbi:MAG: glycogen synthase, partial [Actinomycetota bacterium]